MNNDRIDTLDAVRGLAVMGILLMNIISFAFPEAAYTNPLAMGPASGADIASWAVMSVLIDGKMRAIFSILFGASMLLVCQRAEAAGSNAASIHMRRMAWLFLFGLLHQFFIWSGDILTLYAMVGVIALPLIMADDKGLRTTAWLAFAFNFVMMAGLVLSWHQTIDLASLPGATADQLDEARLILDHLGRSGSPDVQAELAAHLGSYADILHWRVTHDLFLPLASLMASGPETLGFFALGMILLRNGFLQGTWANARYWRLLLIGYGLGLPPLIGLFFWQITGDLDPLRTVGTAIAWSMPFRILVALGHLSAIMLVLGRITPTRLAATGRLAFSNYLGTSLLMTTLFYGYGGGLFGHIARWQAYALVPLVWLLMLAWSKPWLGRYHYGPLEWLWRSAARGAWQPMLR